MENKVIEQQKKELIAKLSPKQLEYLEAVDWLFNGARGAGRTHLICTTVLLHVLNGGDGLALEHTPYNEGSRSYTKALLFDLANSIGLKIKIHEVRNGFVVSRDNPMWVEFDDSKVRGMGRRSKT